jgi:hypothetical protein
MMFPIRSVGFHGSGSRSAGAESLAREKRHGASAGAMIARSNGRETRRKQASMGYSGRVETGKRRRNAGSGW